MNTDLMFSSKKEDWETPEDFYNKLNEEFHFNLDPCCSSENAKCKNYFTIKEDGLKQSWGGIECSVIPRTEEKFPNG